MILLPLLLVLIFTGLALLFVLLLLVLFPSTLFLGWALFTLIIPSLAKADVANKKLKNRVNLYLRMAGVSLSILV